MFGFVGRFICCLCFTAFVEMCLLFVIGVSNYGGGDGATGLEKAITLFLGLSLLVVPGSFYVAWRSTKNVP